MRVTTKRRNFFKKMFEKESYIRFFRKAVEYFELADPVELETSKEKYERALKRKKSYLLNKREARKKAKGRLETIEFYEELSNLNGESPEVQYHLKKARNLGRNAHRIIKK